MKKWISICIFTLCLIFSVNCVWAEGSLSEKQSEAISLMNDLKIYTDITEENASNAITRAEFAKIIVRVMGVESSLTNAPRRIFSDVLPDNDAAASIELLYERGIMMGYGQAEFKPDAVLTLGEAVKVMISITGYSEWAEQQGGYPSGYYATAVSNDILKGVSGAVSEEVNYTDAAVMIQNVLEGKKYRVITGYENNSVVSSDNNEEYMGYALNIYRYTGIVGAYGNTSLYSTDDEYEENNVKIDNEIFETNGIDFSQYLGMKVTAYYKADDSGYYIMHVVADKKSEMIEVKSEDIAENVSKEKFEYYDNNKIKKAKISDNATFIYNGKKLDVVSDADLQADNGYVRLISNNGGSTYDTVIIKDYETFIVDKAIATDSLLYFKYDKGSLDLSSGSNINAKYFAEGKEADFSSISTGSILSIAMSKNTIGNLSAEILISNNQVTGKATKLYNKGTKHYAVLEDGTEYVFTNEYISRLDEGQSGTYEPTVGNEGVFYIDYFNQLAAYAVSGTSKNYAYVVNCYYEPGPATGEIRLFTKDGTFETYTLDKKITFNDKRVDKADVPEMLKTTSPDGSVNQLIICKTDNNGYIKNIKTAVNKTSETYYVASDEEFVLNAHPKNSAGVESGLRFYKNMAENKPYNFVNGKTIRFMVPMDKDNEKAYKIETKLSSTDMALPAPLYLYDAGPGGALGAVVSNTASEGKYSTPCIIDEICTAVNEDDEVGTLIQFVGGQSVFAGDHIIYDQPITNWKDRVDYSNIKVEDLKHGDIIEYTTSNDKVEMLRVIVRVDDIGPIRIDGDHIQLNGNMIADVISVADNGRTAVVKYVDRYGAEQYQSMLVNSTTYRYDSSDGEIYNSSASDLREGDRVLINSYWWSPKLVVIFR